MSSRMSRFRRLRSRMRADVPVPCLQDLRVRRASPPTVVFSLAHPPPPFVFGPEARTAGPSGGRPDATIVPRSGGRISALRPRSFGTPSPQWPAQGRGRRVG